MVSAIPTWTCSARTILNKKIDIQAAVAIAAAEAMAAKTQGTFGVGGVLLDGAGNVLQSMHNNVVRQGLVFDPTAHGERQLVDWYFAERAKGTPLPPPCELTIVTSLDPCCMCTGAILEAGFNVVVAAPDAKAGINYDGAASFTALPQPLQALAGQRFAYPACAVLPNMRACLRALRPSLFLSARASMKRRRLCARWCSNPLRPR